MIKLENVIVDRVNEHIRIYEEIKVRLCKIAKIDLNDDIFNKVNDIALIYPIAGITTLCLVEDLYQGTIVTIMHEQLNRKSIDWIYNNIEQVIDDILRYGSYLGERIKE